MPQISSGSWFIALDGDGGVGLNVVYLLADRVEIETGRSCVRCEFGTTDTHDDRA